MSQVKQDNEREYRVLTDEEKKAGELLYHVYWNYFKQYCATADPKWDQIDVKFKLVWTRTAKAVKYAL